MWTLENNDNLVFCFMSCVLKIKQLSMPKEGLTGKNLSWQHNYFDMCGVYAVCSSPIISAHILISSHIAEQAKSSAISANKPFSLTQITHKMKMNYNCSKKIHVNTTAWKLSQTKLLCQWLRKFPFCSECVLLENIHIDFVFTEIHIIYIRSI